MAGRLAVVLAIALAGLAVAGMSPAALAATSLARGTAVATATAAIPAGRPVVIIGIPGLRWTDISPATAPALWQLAERGSVGSLVVTAVRTYACPADAWLTLGAAARAMAPRPAPQSCPPMPRVVPMPRVAPLRPSRAARSRPPGPGPGPARVPALAGPGGIQAYNRPFSYAPDWGLLARAAGPGRCAVAAGPGAALALADERGDVRWYVPRPGPALRDAERACPLIVADLGTLPGAGGPARRAAVRAASQAAGQVISAAPAGAVIVVAGLGDGTAPHLRAIIVAGAGFRRGLLTSAATRQPGLVLVTDLAPSVLGWRDRRGIAPEIVGAQIRAARRGSLAAAVRTLTGQDTAAQVYRATLAPFSAVYAAGEAAALAAVAVLRRGPGQRQRTRRRLGYHVTAAVGGAVPAGTFLGGLAPWPAAPHPALVLYGAGLTAAAVIAGAALAGPWRRDPLGPAGFIGAVTVAVIGTDVLTGSRLQLDTPFGLSMLTAGRFYGIGNNAIGVYGAGGLLAATWAAVAVARRAPGRGPGRSRRRAAAAAGAVAVPVIAVAGWPGFGAKAGGTIALVPAFGVLLAGLAGVRIMPRRAALIAASGVVVSVALAAVNYLVPGTGPSDIGAFTGHVLHGGAAAILRRKISASARSLTESPAAPVIPPALVAAGLLLARARPGGSVPVDQPPARRAAPAQCARLARRAPLTLSAAQARLPALRPLLAALWVAGVAGWLASDSGVTVPAAALPLVLPAVLAIVTSAADSPAAPACPTPVARVRRAVSPAG
jgi:hypothetical protein